MNIFNARYASILAILTLAPGVASAQTVASFLGLFNIFAGLMVVGGILAFMGGFIRYLVVLGTEKRKQGLYLMTWGITVIFVLDVLLGIINILQGPLSFLIGMFAVVFAIVVAIIAVGKMGGGGSNEAEHKA